MATMMGFGLEATLLIISCPSRLSASAASCVWMEANSSISAPAMKLAGFPERRTSARTHSSALSSEKSISNSLR
jgi:hypothetical protein